MLWCARTEPAISRTATMPEAITRELMGCSFGCLDDFPLGRFAGSVAPLISLALPAAAPYITRHFNRPVVRAPFLHVESIRSGGIMAKLTRIPMAALFTWLVAATCWAHDCVITGRITDSSGAA